MRPSSWSSALVLTGLYLWSSPISNAGDQHPDDLPHETVTLRDGRRLNGYYDAVSAILYLDGPYRARLRLHQGDILRRVPLPDVEPSVPMTMTATATPRLSTIRLREQQVAELERRRTDLLENIRLLSTGLDNLQHLRAMLEQSVKDHPPTGAPAEAIATQQHQLLSEINDLQRRLSVLQDQVTTIERRRDQVQALLQRARQSTSATAQPEITATIDPQLDLRLHQLEDEVRALRADNHELRRRLDLLEHPVQPQIPLTPPTVTPPASNDLPDEDEPVEVDESPDQLASLR